MSLPLLHAGRTNPGLSAALDLRFALDKSLTAYRGPTPSFSRASTGSYFDGSGVLRYANVNLLLQSEAFSTSPWSNLGLPTITTNTDIAPDGKQTADTINDSSTGSFWGVNQTISVTSGATYTFSIYIKKTFVSPTSYPLIQIQVGASNYSALIFNTFNGSISVATGGSYVAPSSYQSVEISGYWRVSITAVINTSSPQMQFYPAGSSDGSTISAAATGSAVVWGAQVEASSTVGTYCPTTSSANSAPRFNHTYNGTSWVSRGLLVEEQRTNLAIWSEDFTNAAWSKPNVNVSGNAVIAPDGNLTADLVYPVPGSTWAYAGIERNNGGGVAGNPMTISFFFKAAGKSWVSLHHGDGSDAAWFNISTGTIGTIVSGNPSISNVGNGWYKCSITRNIASNGSGWTVFRVCDADGSTSVTGSGTNGVYAWGAQTENGAFPTSYIGTTNSSVVRSADVCQITGSDFSGFWNGTEGTLAVEYDGQRASAYIYTARNSGGQWQNSINIRRNTTLDQAQMFVSGTNQAEYSITGPVYGVTVKNASAYKANDFASSFNGSAVFTDNTCTIPTVNLLEIGLSSSEGNPFNGHIARLRYYNKRLPNATLQLLSDPDPTLNLQFALNKTLTPVAGPAPSFSRASTGTYFNASGVLTSASINTPRFDHTYSGGQWVSRGLLIEEQRTNLLPRSEEFNTGWTNNDINISTNSVTAPDGTLTADNLVPNTVNTNHRLYQGPAGSGVASVSIFAKSTGYNWLQVRVGAGGGTSVTVNFDIVNGAIGDTVLAGGATASGQSIENVGNGWWRCKFTTASVPAFTTVIMPRPNNASVEGQAYAGDGVKGVAVWGAQLENASFPTSYIPTTSSSVTRSADVCQITGTSFNWMWNQGEGSFVAEFDRSMAGSVTSDSMIYIAAGTGAPSNVQNGGYVTSGNIIAYGYDSAFTYNFNHGAQLANTAYKIATGIKLNDFASSLNGAVVLTDNSGTVGTNERLLIGHLDWSGGNRLNGHIAKLIYYPARLTNTKLQQLST